MDARGLVRRIREEIPGYAGGAVGTLDGSAYFGDGALAELEEPLRELARAWHASYEAAGGVVGAHDLDEVLTSASRSHLLVKVHHRDRSFVAVMLHATGDIRLLRARMGAYLRQIAA